MARKGSPRKGKKRKEASSEPKKVYPVKIILAIVISTMVMAAIYYETSDVNKPAGGSQNLFTDPGFENTPSGWTYLSWSEFWVPYQIDRGVVHGGEKSALLRLRAYSYSRNTTVCGATQDLSPEEFPTTISGYYRVQNWTRGATHQYLQCAVMVFGVPGNTIPVQIRYLIAGTSEIPFELENAKFIFITQADPVTDVWSLFHRNLHQDFTDAWDFVPTEFTYIRIAFEMRYDDVPYGTTMADVYWDDMSLDY